MANLVNGCVNGMMMNPSLVGGTNNGMNYGNNAQFNPMFYPSSISAPVHSQIQQLPPQSLMQQSHPQPFQPYQMQPQPTFVQQPNPPMPFQQANPYFQTNNNMPTQPPSSVPAAGSMFLPSPNQILQQCFSTAPSHPSPQMMAPQQQQQPQQQGPPFAMQQQYARTYASDLGATQAPPAPEASRPSQLQPMGNVQYQAPNTAGLGGPGIPMPQIPQQQQQPSYIYQPQQQQQQLPPHPTYSASGFSHPPSHHLPSQNPNFYPPPHQMHNNHQQPPSFPNHQMLPPDWNSANFLQRSAVVQQLHGQPQSQLQRPHVLLPQILASHDENGTTTHFMVQQPKEQHKKQSRRPIIPLASLGGGAGGAGGAGGGGGSVSPLLAGTYAGTGTYGFISVDGEEKHAQELRKEDEADTDEDEDIHLLDDDDDEEEVADEDDDEEYCKAGKLPKHSSGDIGVRSSHRISIRRAGAGASSSPEYEPKATSSSKLDGGKKRVARAPVPWNDDEHKLFLLGLRKHGKGNWRAISQEFVTSRSSSQIASHAQKYFIHLASGSKRRHSVFSTEIISTVEEERLLDTCKKAREEIMENTAMKPTTGLFLELPPYKLTQEEEKTVAAVADVVVAAYNADQQQQQQQDSSSSPVSTTTTTTVSSSLSSSPPQPQQPQQ